MNHPHVIAALASLVTALVPTGAAAEISRGPYLQHTRLQAIDIVWEGTIAAPNVGWGLLGPDEQFLDATCNGAHCWVTITGLTPDTVYQYAVYSGGTMESVIGSFRTAPAVPRPFSFVVYGDNRSDDIAHSAVIDAVLERGGFEFALNTGDMVSSGEVEAQWDNFFAIEADLLRDYPIYPSVGNHEEHDGKARITERLFHTPAAASGSDEPLYYSFDYGNSHFVAIDGEINVLAWYFCLLLAKPFDACLDTEQLAWLQADLSAAANDPWIKHIFVFMHKGPYSSKPGRTGSAVIRDLLPLFAQSKVKIVLSGHDHYYEHGISGNGLHYVISGGGGAPLYDTQPGLLELLLPHEVKVSKSVHNYLIVSVDGGLIEVTGYDVDSGTVLETFQIGSVAGCSVPTDCLGQQAGVCPGQWSCPNDTCVWECAPPPSCSDVSDCPPPPDGACLGMWECTITNECHWVCDVVDECANDDDCADKTPLNACEGGHFECETGVCEWVCLGPIPVDQDAGVTDVVELVLDASTDTGTVAQDTASDSDTPTPPDTTPPADTVPDPIVDSGPTLPVDTGTTESPGENDDDGCASAGSGLTGWWLALLGLAALLRQRRHCLLDHGIAGA